MLVRQTVSKLHSLRLGGMAMAFEDQMSNAASHSLSFEDRFGLLVDSEATYRENLRLQRLLKTAKLRVAACIEDIDYRHDRGLDKALMASLVTCDWIDRGHNLILTGPTGCGKTWLACAFGNRACRIGKTVLFHRLPLILEELQIAHGDGSYRKRLATLAKIDLLILDDFGLATLNAHGRNDLLEVVEARTGGRSTIITSQLPSDKWHEFLSRSDPTVADAILDRLTSGAIRLAMRGESMRKLRDQNLGISAPKS